MNALPVNIRSERADRPPVAPLPAAQDADLASRGDPQDADILDVQTLKQPDRGPSLFHHQHRRT